MTFLRLLSLYSGSLSGPEMTSHVLKKDYQEYKVLRKTTKNSKVSDLPIAMVQDQETVLINCLQKPLILLRCTGRKRKFSGNYYIQKD